MKADNRETQPSLPRRGGLRAMPFPALKDRAKLRASLPRRTGRRRSPWKSIAHVLKCFYPTTAALRRLDGFTVKTGRSAFIGFISGRASCSELTVQWLRLVAVAESPAA